MTVTGKILKQLQDGRLSPLAVMQFQKLLSAIGYIKPDAEYEIKISEHRGKRSLSANSYLWVLVGKIAQVLSNPAESDHVYSSKEVYRKYISEYGLFRDIACAESGVKTVKHVWEKQGIGWFVEQLDFTEDGSDIVLRCYYGSSCYDSRTFSRLLDAIIQDAKALGIEVRPEEEIRSMLGSREVADV